MTVERGSDKHGRLLDEALDHETLSLRQGSPAESRADERRLQEDGGDGEPSPDALLTSSADYGGLSHDEVEARSDLARHLRPSIFPAAAPVVRQSAIELGADQQTVAALETLPDRTYQNVGEVWEALGGHTEAREHDLPALESEPELQPTPEPAPEPEPPAAVPPASRQRFDFAFDPLFRVLDGALGVTPSRAYVEIDDERLVARFGRWLVETPRGNIECAEVTGPYLLPKVLGPPRLSFKDRGLTFATNSASGVCIQFRDPVRGIDPLGLIRHRGLTVTVADPESLVRALT